MSDFKLIPFKKEHLHGLLEQKINFNIKDWMINGHADSMEKEPEAFTGMVGDQVAVCGGIARYWPNRGYLWVVFNSDSKYFFVPVFRGIKKFLSEYPCVRLEISVPTNFEIGHRRARLLGFELETPKARKFLSDGTDCSLYALVKEGPDGE